MPRLCRRALTTLGLLATGGALLFLGWHEKHGYLDPVAAGAKALQEGRLDDPGFERARGNLLADPDLLAYNEGVKASAAGDLEAAADLFLEVVSRSRSPDLRAKALYNLGTLLAPAGKPREAATRYREALRLDPWDWDAKANLELLAEPPEAPEAEQAPGPLKPAPEPGREATGEAGVSVGQSGL